MESDLCAMFEVVCACVVDWSVSLPICVCVCVVILALCVCASFDLCICIMAGDVSLDGGPGLGYSEKIGWSC